MLPRHPAASNGIRLDGAPFPLCHPALWRTLSTPSMDPTPTVFIRWQGKPTGPFSAEQLRELIASGAVTPATDSAPEPAGPWTRLDAGPLRSALFPSVTFKTPTYERTNTSASPTIDLHDVIAAAQRPTPPSALPLAPARPASAEHDVASLLLFNQAIEKKHGRFTLAPHRPRKSRRLRDYLVLLFGIGGLIFAILIVEAMFAVSMQTMASRMPDQFWPVFTKVLFHSPIMAWGLACFTFYAAALTWLMFGLMDDY